MSTVMEEEETEFEELPVNERCKHKLWKARLNGFEEAIQIFNEIGDKKSTEWNKFHKLIEKFVTDSHPMAQERGLEATLIYVENCGHAGKIVRNVMAGLVSKCIAAPKAKTKDLAAQIALMFIEIEKQDIALEELVKGMEQKNPNIVAGSTAIVTLALNQFGNKVVAIKPLIEQIPVLLANQHKNVRDEGKALIVEIYRWIGDALKPHLSSFSTVTVIQTELENEFQKVKSDNAVPSRYLRSQQMKNAAAGDASNDNDDTKVDGNNENEPAAVMDSMDVIGPVDILSKLPKDFRDKLEEEDWQVRKKALEALEVLLKNNPKISNGKYDVVVKALKEVIAHDSNVVLVEMAGKLLAALARGLNKEFSTYALECMSTVLEKFKEKKAKVVAALRECMDAMYPSLPLKKMEKCVVEALKNKNPSIKTETCLFLARAFSKTLPAVFNEKLLKSFVEELLKTLNESDPAVRDASAETLGTLQKLLGEKIVAPHLVNIDPLKLAKIKECAEKAVIVVKVPAAPKSCPATSPSGPSKPAAKEKEGAELVARPSTAVAKKPAPVKKPASSSSSSASAPVEKIVAPHLVNIDPLKLAKIKECAEKAVIVVKVPAAPKSCPATSPSGPSKPAAKEKEGAELVARPSTAVAKKPAPVKKPASSSSSSASAPVELEMTPEEVDERASHLLPRNLLSKLVDEDWMTRLSASETFLKTVGGLEICETISQILIRALCKKPGLKENNFQVLKLKLDILKKIVEVFGISTTTGDMILNDVVETLGDDENSANAAQCLILIADAINLEYVIVKMLSYSFEQSSPKVQMMALLLSGEAIRAFGLQVQPKKLIEFMKKALQSVNATVRQATITTLGIIYLHTGDSLMEFFNGENETIKQQIQAEFQKRALQKSQKPTRRARSRSRGKRSNSRNRSRSSRKRSKSRSRSRKRSRSKKRSHSRKSKKRSSPKRSRSRSKRSRTPMGSRSRTKRSRSPKDRRKRSRSRQKSSSRDHRKSSLRYDRSSRRSRSRSRQKSSSRDHRKSSLRDDRSSRRSRSRSRGSRDRHRSRKHDLANTISQTRSSSQIEKSLEE